jgi:hypothetical protein
MAEDARITRALVDVVHQWLLVRRETTPLRDLEEEMGLSRSTIHKFERQKSYPRQIWPKLRAWYVSDRQARYGAAPDEDPVSHVLGALRNLSHVPASQKPRAMKALARAHRELCTTLAVPCPAWVELLDEMADAEARQHPPRHESEYRIPPRRNPRDEGS